jgi:hypothetical protein
MSRADAQPGLRPAARDVSRRRRGAALYLTTIAVSVLVAGMGLALIASQRADRRLQANIGLESQCWWAARSGLELAYAFFEEVSDWRTRASGGTLFSGVEVSPGCVAEVRFFDDDDGSLVNDETDTVRIRSIGTCQGNAVRLEATLAPRPHPVLSYALFNSDYEDVRFRDLVTIAGPVRSSGKIEGENFVRVQGNASFTTRTGGEINGPLSPRIFVDTELSAPQPPLATYLAMATPIAGANGSTCGLRGYNLTPTHNPVGSPNANGIYALDPGNRDVVIQNIHIRGTLIIYNLDGRTVSISSTAWLEPGPLNYPVLMIYGTNVELSMQLSTSLLSELTATRVTPYGSGNLTVLGVDFNENGLLLDTIVSSVRGIVYAPGARVRLGNSGWTMSGCLISRRFEAEDSVRIEHDLSVLNVLAPGFLDAGMRIVQGTYREIP